MSRIVGIGMIALAAWAGAEFYTKGVDGAFGGIFAGATDPIVPLEEVERVQTLGQRVGEQVQVDIERSFQERTGRLD